MESQFSIEHLGETCNELPEYRKTRESDGRAVDTSIRRYMFIQWQ